MKSKGFTLIELAVVLAIIAVLAAVLTPMVTGYIDQARVARAMGDVRSIADAARLYQRDVGEFPIWDASSYNGGAGTPLAAIAGTNGIAATNPTAYGTVAANTSLEGYLNANTLSRSTTAAVGRVAFRGPYLGNLDADPWGYKYYLTGTNLKNGAANWGFVVSPGPNGALDTSGSQPKTGPFVVGGDDIAVAIR